MIAETLEQTEKLLLKKGWVQYDFNGPNGSHCLAGALYEATGNDAESYAETRHFLNDFLGAYELGDEYITYVTGWNDEHTRTLEEVIWMLDEAIDDARERGL